MALVECEERVEDMPWPPRCYEQKPPILSSRPEQLGLLLLLSVLFIWTLAPLAGYDFWFYLAVGREIVETGQIPWSQTYLGTTSELGFGRYADVAWLGNLLCYLAFLAAGPLGLVLLKSALLTATTALVYLCCRLNDLPPFWAGAWSTLGLWTIRGRFEMRTYLFTDLALVALVLLLLVLEARGRTRPRDLALTVGLFSLWANLHQGILAGFVVVGCWLILGRLPFRQRLMVTFAAATGSMLKPYAIHFPAFVYDHFANTSAIQGVVEWAQPSTSVLLYQLGPFFTVVFLVLSLFLAKLIRCKSLAESPPWAFAALVLLFSLLAARSIRSVSELLPVVTPLLAAYMPKLTENRRFQAVVAGFIAVVFFTSFHVRNLQGLQDTHGYPEQLVDAIPVHDGQLFNSFEFGNYLVFRQVPPFLHGMTGLYQEQLITDFEDVLNPTPRRAEVLEKFQIDAALLHLPTENDATTNFVEFLAGSPNWNFELWDDTGLLFVRSSENKPGLVSVWPWRIPAWTDPVAAEAELLALVEKRPSAMAHRFLSQLQLARGDVSSALRQAELSISLSPYFAGGWSQLGLCYAKAGNLEGTLRASQQAVEHSPQEASFRFNLALALFQTSQYKQGLSAKWYRWRAGQELRRCLALDPEFEAAYNLQKQILEG